MPWIKIRSPARIDQRVSVYSWAATSASPFFWTTGAKRMAASDVLELTEDELRNWLKVHAKLDAGSINQWCKKNGQDQSGVWNFVTGKTAAQPKLLALLGFERH